MRELLSAPAGSARPSPGPSTRRPAQPAGTGARAASTDAKPPTCVGARPMQPSASSTPLSSRERDVLRLLASDLDGPAIARST